MPDANLPDISNSELATVQDDAGAVATVSAQNDKRPVLLLCGGGPVARSVAILAQTCGFAVDVADSRAEQADPAQYPGARHCITVPGWLNLVHSCNIGSRHHIVIATGNDADDYAVLRQVLSSHAFYIGMEGDHVKKKRMFAALRHEGVPAAELACVRCPVGLPIGAQSPEQLAVGTVAEVLAARAGTLQRLRKND